jgi:hypothetical protein
MSSASRLVAIITSSDPAVRNRSLDSVCRGASLPALLAECAALDTLRRESGNLYERVRACFFLYATYRFHLPNIAALQPSGVIPYEGYTYLLERRFEEAIDTFLASQAQNGPSDSLSSALAAAYHRLAFQTLANQVRRSVRSVRGNQWMFRMGHPADHPLRVRPELLRRDAATGTYPMLRESTPVRMDLSHSGWSDIFFLGMDYPEGARVLNVSIDLAVRGRDARPQPPIEAHFRVIDEPIIRLVSVDLGAKAEVTSLAEVFDFAKDYLGLLKAALIAAGIVPPGIEGAQQSLEELLASLVGRGRGIELVSHVRGIPKGSRLAVSTNLLAALIAACMRATGQAQSLIGGLTHQERRLVAARAILGEWLGGSGGGWQDSGGVWPGIKLITGVTATPDDPEYGISRGCLLPQHQILGEDQVAPATRQALQDSLVLVHGGMAQNVGPILEMVTEKYLLRSEAEWSARQQANGLLDEILADLIRGDVPAIGRATTRNFQGPIQTIIPWTTNLYTETLIARVRERFGAQFWGFWMLGGMSGGGMGFIFQSAVKRQAQDALQELMTDTKRRLQHALPFAMEPVVYDFAINERGTWSELLEGHQALLPAGYYPLIVPDLIRQGRYELTAAQRAELDHVSIACRARPELSGMMQSLFDALLPRLATSDSAQLGVKELLAQHGFDRLQHEAIREDLRSGRIGLAQNRLPVSTDIADVCPGDVVDATQDLHAYAAAGREALRAGQVAVVTLAGGVGSRWTQGAGVVKSLDPFCVLGGKHRTFLEVHLAKSRRSGRLAEQPLPHIITTSYLTHQPIAGFLAAEQDYGYPGELILSEGRAIGQRLVPMSRDLRFAWEELPQQLLDEQAQKVRESLHTALIGWARAMGEGTDYRDNLAMQCLNPVGHWYEVPNLLRNGTLARLLRERPRLRYLLVHNIDTLGANVDPAVLGLVMERGAMCNVEVCARRVQDRGGGLARVNGRLRLLEGLAMPHEEDEFKLTYYNTNTFWLEIDPLLRLFGLERGNLDARDQVDAAVRAMAARMPTYITLKEVKKRWGQGQEDVYPVAQYEKLWGDMTALPEVQSAFLSVPRQRGQQLKEHDQLDGWFRDGSAAYIASLCDWQ